MEYDSPLLSVVVIGLNEQDRLRESLEAVFAQRPRGYEIEVLYVDSGSTDRSVEIAGAVPGVEVLHLTGGRPSAARARNVGLRRARGEFVQLIDGDSVIQHGWFDRALEILNAQPDASCVFGRCSEMFPDQSIYMKVCGFDWLGPEGDRRYCGGNAMWRLSTVAKHGYFDERIRSGEEPELCYRVRHSGGRIICIDVPMVKHDLGMRHFSQYWARAINVGRGVASIALRFCHETERLWLREMIVNFLEPVIWIALLATGWSIFDANAGLAILVIWWLLRAVQISYSARRLRMGVVEGIIYGLHCQFVRLPLAIGQLTTLLDLHGIR